MTYYSPFKINNQQKKELTSSSNKVVVKRLSGSGGKNVNFIDADRVNDNLSTENIVQKIDGKTGVDYRYNVIGNKVVSVFKRTSSNPNEPRANVALGGKEEEIQSDPDFEKVALSAARALGVEDCAGIDLIDGCKVLEVNAVPGFSPLPERKEEICKAIIDTAVKKAAL